MSDIKKICEAMAALAKAADVGSVTVNDHGDTLGISVILSFRTDSDARTVADALGIALRTADAKDSQWLAGDCAEIGGNIAVSVYGPHHPKSKPDPAEVEAALAKAQEALS